MPARARPVAPCRCSGAPRRRRLGAAAAHAAVPARLRQPSRAAHRVVVHHRAMRRPAAREFGFQLTFFRSRVDATQDLRSAFAARQLIFAHAAITDLEGAQALARPAHRARRLRRRVGLGGRHRRPPARLDAGARRRAATTARLPRRAASRSICASRRRSRCCCRASAGLSRKGPRSRAGQLLLQRAAARGAGPHRAAGPRASMSTGTRLARPRVERGLHAPRGGGLGLDRHEPRSTAAR